MNCVLIVEDDSDINNFINDYFVIKGYSTIQAFSGTEGLLRLKNERDICCVILDLMLPGISGEEIIQEIRKVSDVPIITVSAKNEEELGYSTINLLADNTGTEWYKTRKEAEKSVKEISASRLLNKNGNDLER